MRGVKATNEIQDDKLAAKSAHIFATIAIGIFPIGLITWINNQIEILWPWYLAIFMAVLCYFITVKIPNLKKNQAISIFMILCSVIFLASSITTECILAQKINADLFGGYKYISLLIALIAPSPLWLGYFLISCCLFVPPVQVLIFSPEISLYSSYREPWVSMGYAVVAFFILKYRLESQKLQASLIESKANEKSLSDFADVAIALRDLSNTPLQSLGLLADLLENEQITYQQAAELLKSATYKLHEIIHIFNEQQKKMEWRDGQESLDSLEVLRQNFIHPELNKKKQG